MRAEAEAMAERGCRRACSKAKTIRQAGQFDDAPPVLCALAHPTFSVHALPSWGLEMLRSMHSGLHSLAEELADEGYVCSALRAALMQLRAQWRTRDGTMRLLAASTFSIHRKMLISSRALRNSADT